MHAVTLFGLEGALDGMMVGAYDGASDGLIDGAADDVGEGVGNADASSNVAKPAISKSTMGQRCKGHVSTPPVSEASMPGNM